MLNKYLLFLLFFATTIFAQFGVGPKIRIKEYEHDFGKVKQGSILKYDFILSNLGSEMLELENVHASCGCTVVKPDKNTIKPGETAKLAVSFNTSGREGNQKKEIYVFSNDPVNKEEVLTITAEVYDPDEVNDSLPKISFSETSFNFGDAEEGTLLTHTFIIANEGKKTLKIENVYPSCGCTTTDINKKELLPNERTELKIHVNTKGFAGPIKKNVTVMSNDKKKSVIGLLLSANIKQKIENKK